MTVILESESVQRNMSILIVDDQPDNLRTLTAILRHEQYRVRQALSGKIALAAIQAAPPELLLLDIRMPDMDGYQLCSLLKANPATSEIPIIFLSALNDVNDKVKAFAAGAADYITKPFQAEEVLVRIGHHLTIRQQKRLLLHQNQQLQQTEELLRFQAEQERLMGTIVGRIRQSLDKESVFKTTVSAIQQVFQAERVLIYRVMPDKTGQVVAETVRPGFLSLQGMSFPAEVFPASYHTLYSQGRICIINDVQCHTADITPCLREFVSQWQVQAKLVVPIVLAGELWGLLILHHCSSARNWLPTEVSLLSQLAEQIAIAIQQAELYYQIQQFNGTLERQVHLRTLQLQQSLIFEATLKRISDKVRDSLDSQQVLQTVVTELAQALEAYGCDATLYRANHASSSIYYQSLPEDMASTQGQPLQMQDSPELYGQLQQGQCFAFCQIQLNPIPSHCAILVCPILEGILEDQSSTPDMMGALWVFKSAFSSFSEMEIHLVQQVANQSAIALRQAHLYEAAQAQVTELERLNQLKDDFLSTISHEFRTPISNMKLTLQLLNHLFNREPALTPEIRSTVFTEAKIQQYFQVLKDECDRELRLIEDLLQLQQLEANVYLLQPTSLHLQDWIPHLMEAFELRAASQQLTLTIQVDPHLPSLYLDVASLSRILCELLTNACKYTPAGGEISVQAFQENTWLHLRVINRGIEIPQAELTRVFDKFYRIPNNDPWKHGGTGLGLALIKRLVMALGGTIHTQSGNNSTEFMVQLPLQKDLSNSFN